MPAVPEDRRRPLKVVRLLALHTVMGRTIRAQPPLASMREFHS
eukprot:CAMPEP_0198122350 /NCGR_PEP_ID=MMETSP1442-20131203/34590_1 /TAXON_ID= /ORGANISM="Craspedostauros australis, Strain CCMP3328" /LENGTH=42 /DNA_ID= /DNA_START= /DNA_END= /DNA_ORIENTATION=